MGENLIVLAAGFGSRMGELTKNKPKIALEIKGNVMLSDVLRFAAKEFEWRKKLVVLGHGSSEISIPGFDKIINSQYQITNMAYSLLLGLKSLNAEGDTVVVYGDLILDFEFLKPVIESSHNITVSSVDDFINLWSSRFVTPEQDAESFIVDKSGKIVEIGKPIRELNQMDGQFGGAIKIKASKFEEFTSLLEQFCQKHPKAFLTDFLQFLVESREPLFAVKCSGIWFEVDSPSDLKLANEDVQVQKLLKKVSTWKTNSEDQDIG